MCALEKSRVHFSMGFEFFIKVAKMSHLELLFIRCQSFTTSDPEQN